MNNDTPVAGRAGFGMYPFEPLRPVYARYWEAIRERAPWLPSALEWDVDLDEQWVDPTTAISYTCGWPLVTRLADYVESGHLKVVGSFVHTVAQADGPTYRSVLVARRAGEPSDFAGLRAAANSTTSLSGWVSLLHAVHGPGARWEGDVLVTGAHVESLRAVGDGRADIASIDAVTLAHLRRLMPEVCEGLVEVGAGPRVGCLPVIAGPMVAAERLAEVQRAFADALAHPSLADVREALLVEAFVPVGVEHYVSLHAIAPQ